MAQPSRLEGLRSCVRREGRASKAANGGPERRARRTLGGMTRLLVFAVVLGCGGSSESPAAPGTETADTSPIVVEDSSSTIDSAVAEVADETMVTDTDPTDASMTETKPDAGCAAGRGTWVWGSDVVEKPADRAAFFAFAAKHPVRTVYVEAEGLFGSSADPPLLVSFVSEARAKCIDVQLLFGRATWLRPAEHVAAVGLATKGVSFAKKHPGVTAVHFDVEPHGVPEWHADVWDANNEALVNDFVDLLEKLRTVTKGSGVDLTVDIPFWYDGTHQITRAGKRRPAMEYVIDTVDVTTLMDYRDVAEGPDGIVANADAELTYASSVAKRVVIGLETLCLPKTPAVSFCEEGSAVLEKELSAAAAKFASKTAFSGFAIHHYVSWSALKP